MTFVTNVAENAVFSLLTYVELHVHPYRENVSHYEGVELHGKYRMVCHVRAICNRVHITQEIKHNCPWVVINSG